MKNLFFTIAVSFFTTTFYAQHNIKNWVIGAQVASPFSDLNMAGTTIQANYASNCYTVFVNEFTAFNILDTPFFQAASSVTLIINNFKRQNFYLTGGIGLSVTKLELQKEELDAAFFAFTENDFHLSTVFKIRGLLQLNDWLFWTSEINVNTLGNNFVTFSTGINYELPQLRARSR